MWNETGLLEIRSSLCSGKLIMVCLKIIYGTDSCVTLFMPKNVQKLGPDDGNDLWQTSCAVISSFRHHFHATITKTALRLSIMACFDARMSFVAEDGRLERELAYSRSRLGEGSGITSELVIQTPQHGGSVLSVESLLLHYDALLAASQVTVDMYDM